jgi:hypothetical protein
MPSFENIHKNHKWAFVDGLLCGIVLAWIGKLWYDAAHYYDTPPEVKDPSDIVNEYYLLNYAEQR